MRYLITLLLALSLFSSCEEEEDLSSDCQCGLVTVKTSNPAGGSQTSTRYRVEIENNCSGETEILEEILVHGNEPFFWDAQLNEQYCLRYNW